MEWQSKSDDDDGDDDAGDDYYSVVSMHTAEPHAMINGTQKFMHNAYVLCFHSTISADSPYLILNIYIGYSSVSHCKRMRCTYNVRTLYGDDGASIPKRNRSISYNNFVLTV